MSALTAFALDYFLNSLWQLPLLFLCGWLAARLLHPLGPLAEHRVWTMTLLLEAVLPACSLSPSSLFALLVRSLPHHTPARNPGISTLLGSGSALAALHLPVSVLSIVMVFYGLFLVAVSLRFIARSLALSSLRHSATPLSLAPESAVFWHRCADHFAVHNATLATSSRVGAPVTFGLRERLILLPGHMLDGLSNADLHTVLAHEFAHLSRHDFIKNLLYELVALPISGHPLLWLTQARLQQTREIVCDQLAASLTSRREYARSLLRLASLLLNAPPPPAPHAIGILDAHTFERRLMHLTELPRTVHGLRRALPVVACVAVAFATCTTALALRVNVTAPAVFSGDGPSTPAARPAKVSAGVMAGSLLTRVNPTYPQAARDAKIQGAVLLHVVIGKDGTIENLQVLSGPKELRASTLDAVRQWTYKPFLLNGDPVEVETTITVNYSLQP